MNLSRTAAVPQPRPVTGGRAWSRSRSPRSWRSGSSSMSRFRISCWIRRCWLATGRDAGGCSCTLPRGAVALLTGPVQLWLGISRRAMRMHRGLGLAYVASVGVQLDRRVLPRGADGPRMDVRRGITGLGIAWVVTTTMAIAAVRRGLIEQHQEWMIRSYVVTFAFVTFRVLWTRPSGRRRRHAARAARRLQLVLLGRAAADPRGRAARSQDVWRPSLVCALALVLVLSPCRRSALRRPELTGADLEGLVRDESGGVLAGAVVTIVNTETDCRPHDRDRRARPVPRARPAPRLLLDQASIDEASHPAT